MDQETLKHRFLIFGSCCLIYVSSILATILAFITKRPIIVKGLGQVFNALIWLLPTELMFLRYMPPTPDYKIFGIENPDFQNSVKATLNRVGLDFQEEIKGFILLYENVRIITSLGVDTRIPAFFSENGKSNVIMIGGNNEFRKHFVRTLKQYYRETQVKMTIKRLSISNIVFLIGLITCSASLYQKFTQ